MGSARPGGRRALPVDWGEAPLVTIAGTTTQGSATVQTSGVRRGADVAFAVLAALFTAGVLVQVYLAGVGAFGDHPGDHRAPVDHETFGAHETFGNVLGVVAVVLFLVALVARAGRPTVVGSLVLALLTEAAQHGLANAGHSDRWVGGLHAFDGMLILGLAVWLAVAARRRVAGR